MSTATKRAAALTLYDIGDDFLTIFDWLEENEGELTPELEELLNEAEETLEEKVARIFKVRRTLDLTMDNINREIERLTALRKQQEHRRAWLDTYVMQMFDRIGKARVDTAIGKVGIRANSSARIDVPADLAGVPAEFIVTPEPVQPPPHLDREAFLAALKAAEGEPLPGETITYAGVTVSRGRHVRYW